MHNNHHQEPPTERISVLASLRNLIPPRQLHFAESLRIAELQANRLLELTEIIEAPTPTEVVTELPRIRIERQRQSISGLSYWDGQNWVIRLDPGEPSTRQRFTLLHEYKHIIDHGHTGRLYTGQEQAEQAADYFAGCALMPKRLLKRAWGQIIQRPATLARRFGVSPRAVEVRLAQLGLTEPRQRCAVTLRPRRRTYYRQRSAHPPVADLAREAR